jgi:FkbM family methyltransferase
MYGRSMAPFLWRRVLPAPLRARLRDLARDTAGIDVVPFRADSHPLARRVALFRAHNVDCVLDVGANVGQYAIELRRLGYEGRMISFEPLAAAFADLERNARADRLGTWSAIHAAVGATSGTTVIHVAGNSVSSSILPMLEAHRRSAPQAAYVRDEVVPLIGATELKRHAAGARRPLLKLDVQGFEAPIIRALGSDVGWIAGVQLEMSLIPLYDGEMLMPDMTALLASLGFELMALEPGHSDAATGRLLQVDGLFFRRGNEAPAGAA